MAQMMTDSECRGRNAKSDLMKARALNPLLLLDCATGKITVFDCNTPIIIPTYKHPDDTIGSKAWFERPLIYDVPKPISGMKISNEQGALD